MCNNKDTVKDGFDVEATAEIIGDKLMLTTKIINHNEEISNLEDGFVDVGTNLIVEE